MSVASLIKLLISDSAFMLMYIPSALVIIQCIGPSISNLVCCSISRQGELDINEHVASRMQQGNIIEEAALCYMRCTCYLQNLFKINCMFTSTHYHKITQFKLLF